MLFESYLSEYSALESKLNILKQKLKSAEEGVILRLDTSRNQLLIADTCISVCSLCIGTGSFVGSIFGMNLKNHHESRPHFFAHVTWMTVSVLKQNH